MKRVNLFKKTLILLVGLAVFSTNTAAFAAPTAPSEAKLTITFDDALASTYNYALPILAQRNLKATLFATTGFINTGVTDDGRTAMNWSQATSLQNQYGWEVGSHTINHPELPLLTVNQIKTELNNSKNTLVSKGFNITSFASPYGAYDNKVLTEVLKTYNSHRGFWDRDSLNGYNYDRAVIQVQSVESATTLAQIYGWIEQAKAEKKWLVLVFHEVLPVLDPEYEYVTTTADFTAMADYIKASGIKTVLMNHTLQKPGANLLANSTFAQGLSAGWTTDNSTLVKLNTASKGSYPSPVQSIEMNGSTKASHLFSPPVTANSASTYKFEAFVNSDTLTKGEIGFYIDEYGAAGNWVSGQWLGAVPFDKVTYFSTLYQPTSANVATFKIQTYMSAGAKGKAFVDNYELYNLDPGEVAPPAPEPVNLVVNSSFEETTNGWANGWTKDNNFYSIDTGSQGNSGPNSVKLVQNGTVNAHLFSSSIAVESGTNYTWSQFIKTTSASGEFGFYIDEYDASGNWVSGQWKGMINSAFTGTKTFTYTPTSSNVKTIRLQYYVVGGSNFTLYLDSISLIR